MTTPVAIADVMCYYSRVMKTSRSVQVALAAITLLAFGLRVYHLDGQSLWYDEGFSAYLAHMPLGDITARTAADIQPPLYYYLLHVWMALAGDSEFALRFLSVIFGALTVPLLYALTRRLLSPRVGILATLLLAVSPFHIWYAQETRMYTLVTALGVLSSWLLLTQAPPTTTVSRSWQDSAGQHQVRRWVLYALTSVAAIYTHYYAFFLVAFQAAYLLIWWAVHRQKRVAWTGLTAQTTTVVAYLPWAGFALNRYAVDESYWEGVLSPDFVRKTILAFATGHTVYEAQAQAIAIGYVALLVLGICVLGYRPLSALGRPRLPLVFLLLYLVVPFVLLYALSVWRPKFNPRYLMLASPAFILLVASGIGWGLPRRGVLSLGALLRLSAAAAALVYVLATSAYALYNNYTNRVYVRDDFRSVAHRIVTEKSADETVLLCSGHMLPVYRYYDAASPVIKIPDLETLSTRVIVTYDVADELNRAAERYGGVWLVLWQNEVVDPNNILTGLLDAQAERQDMDSRFWGIEVRHYRLPSGVRFARPQIDYPLQVNFADRLELLGFNAAASVASGGVLPLTLFWQARRSLDEDYWLALRLVDATGNTFGRADQRPASYTYPTTRWRTGVLIPGQATLPVAAGTPPGDYALQVAIFTPARGQNLDVLDEHGAPAGVYATLGTIRVAPPKAPPGPQDLGMERIVLRPLGNGMELVATTLTDRSVRQGETVRFEIAWRNNQPVIQDMQVRLLLLDGDKILYEGMLPVTTVPYSPVVWPVGSIIRGHYRVVIPADAPETVQVQVGLTGSSEVVTLARLSVQRVARVTALPTMQYRQDATFGNVAALRGYDVSPLVVRAGETLALTLYWQALEQAATSPAYVVFTHLLGADGRLYGLHDGPPAEGTRPTPGWVTGEFIIDRHILSVKADAPAGRYRLEIGLYEPSTGRRLPVATGGDHVLLTVSVEVRR